MFQRQPTLSILKSCFFNLDANCIIEVISQAIIRENSFLNNTSNNFITASEFQFSTYNNNISYNSLNGKNTIVKFSSVRIIACSLYIFTFAHNYGSLYLLYFNDYTTVDLADSVFINNSCVNALVYVGSPFGSDDRFNIRHSYFFNNYDYQSFDNVSIFSYKSSFLKIIVSNCQTDSTFPSKNLLPNAEYIDNNESIAFDRDDIVVWSLPIKSIISTPIPSEGFICEINPIIPWPTSTPTQSPTFSPLASPSKSPLETPTQSPSQSPTATPSQSPSQSPTQSPSQSPSETPTQSPSQSPTETPSQSPSQSPTQSPSQSPSQSPQATFSPFPTFSALPTDSPSSTDIFAFTDLPYTERNVKTGQNNAGLIAGIIIALIAIIAIVVCSVCCLKKNKKCCFKDQESVLMSSVDLLESNPPLLDSNPDELMSGKEDVFAKTPRKNVFNYSLYI